jgi:predicted dehydrogenase
MGRTWARAITNNPDVCLVGWVDLVQARVVEGIEEVGLGDVAIEDDLDVALGKCSPDFVVDVTAPEAHYEVTRCCLERGVAVLGEKPMATNLDEARALVEVSRRTSSLFVVSQNRRYHPGLVAFRRLVAERLGGIGELSADFYGGSRFGGFREEMASPLLVDMAIHTFDAARYITGADALSVCCTEFNPAWSWYRGSASAYADFELSGGIRFSYRGSWCAEGLQTSWEAEWRAVGALGSAKWDGSGNPVAEVRPLGDRGGSLELIEAKPVPLPGEGIAGSLGDFVRALRTGEPVMNECGDNIKSFAMVMAALASSASGGRVEVGA